jgi:hypothetical protein
MIPRDWGRRTYEFAWINPAFPVIVITARVIEISFKDGRCQQVAPIHWQAIRGMCQGTMRPLFGCPCCSHHTFKLYDVYGELYCWKCAFARGVRYASQQLSDKGRQYLQATRLRHFLNGWANLPPSKTPFMHKQTYRRLTHQLRQLEAKSQTKVTRKLSHHIIKPPHMYRTQTASIANV